MYSVANPDPVLPGSFFLRGVRAQKPVLGQKVLWDPDPTFHYGADPDPDPTPIFTHDRKSG